VPAAAVIPALKAYIMDVAVKKFVVEVEGVLGRVWGSILAVTGHEPFMCRV
jgi:hypothetical protein